MKNRNIAHIVKEKFGTHNLVNKLYKEYWPEYKTLDTIHLFIRWFKEGSKSPEDFDESDIINFNQTYGVMCRDVLNRIKQEF